MSYLRAQQPESLDGVFDFAKKAFHFVNKLHCKVATNKFFPVVAAGVTSIWGAPMAGAAAAAGSAAVCHAVYPGKGTAPISGKERLDAIRAEAASKVLSAQAAGQQTIGGLPLWAPGAIVGGLGIIAVYFLTKDGGK